MVALISKKDFSPRTYRGAMSCATCGRPVFRRISGTVEHSSAGFSTCSTLKPVPDRAGIIYRSYAD